MQATPWHLFLFGIALIVVGSLVRWLFGANRRPRIDPRMSDAEIARRLRRASSPGWSRLMVRAGWLCLLISIAWRFLA